MGAVVVVGDGVENTNRGLEVAGDGVTKGALVVAVTAGAAIVTGVGTGENT